MSLMIWSFGLGLVGLLAGLSLTAILVFFDPRTSEPLIFVLFYLSLFTSLTDILTLIGLLARRVSSRKRFSLSAAYAVRQLEVSFRQGILLTAILVTALILQSQRVLVWWILIILVAMVAGAEWWLSKKT